MAAGLAAAAVVLSALPTSPLRLWPGMAPGDKPGEVGPEGWLPDHGDNVTRLTNVTVPTLTFFPAPDPAPTRPIVVICPGGGYSILAWNLEGTEIAAWLNSLGVSAAILKYRVPRREGREIWDAPLQDAQRALGIVRAHADEWGINKTSIGIHGFSAGGHLTAALSTNFEHRTYPHVDSSDDVSCRPDFAIPVYPAYLVADDNLRKLQAPIKVTKDTPITVTIQAEDDPVHVENAVEYFLGLKDAGVLAEAHLFPTGGHGYGMRKCTGEEVCTWPERVAQFLKARHII